MHVDELWNADVYWPNYFLKKKVWVYADDYRAELTGDQDYSRIIIQAGNNEGWIFHRRLKDKHLVHNTLKQISLPVSEKQLLRLGFDRWQENYL